MTALAAADPEFKLTAALDAPNHPRLGQDVGLVAGVGELGVRLAATLDAPVDPISAPRSPNDAAAATAAATMPEFPINPSLLPPEPPRNALRPEGEAWDPLKPVPAPEADCRAFVRSWMATVAVFRSVSSVTVAWVLCVIA